MIYTLYTILFTIEIIFLFFYTIFILYIKNTIKSSLYNYFIYLLVQLIFFSMQIYTINGYPEKEDANNMIFTINMFYIIFYIIYSYFLYKQYKSIKNNKFYDNNYIIL
jgi:hypothetical protein